MKYKADKQVKQLEEKLKNAKTKKEKSDIRQKIKNIRENANITGINIITNFKRKEHIDIDFNYLYQTRFYNDNL